MADKTGIEWTDATWNPIVGCTHVSAGCDHCYAAREASGRLRNHEVYKGLAVDGKFTGEVRLLGERVEQPLHWTRPRRVFVNSMSDLFHDKAPDNFIAQIFAVMACAPLHQFQVLTKRPGRMRSLLNHPDFRDQVRAMAEIIAAARNRSYVDSWPLPNVWLGTSAEDQRWFDIRVPQLLQTPAAVRFLSLEPLLGPINMYGRYDMPAGSRATFDWVIVGGESGPHARPMHPVWATDIAEACRFWGIPFLFKQWGEWAPHTEGGVQLGDICMSEDGFIDTVGPDYVCLANESDGTWMRRVGKKAAGRELDGRTWDGYPKERVDA